jgi:hypothetical protein
MAKKSKNLPVTARDQKYEGRNNSKRAVAKRGKSKS